MIQFRFDTDPDHNVGIMTTEGRYLPWEGPNDLSNSRLNLLNSFTGKKDPFTSHDSSNRVTWYICGPTVYDSAHVGHASNYVRFDIVRRVLSDYFGYDVVVQMNVTDIDDKIIKRANERKIPFEQLSRHYETEFMEDMDSLNVLRPHYLTRVSEYVPEVIDYIEQIIRNGFAYESEGSVYFDTTAFQEAGHHYGKLEPWSVGNEELLAEGEGALTAFDESVKTQKKSAGDFVLWKKSKPDEPTWDSPWGPGRPGWHIECSTMASNILGPVIDIHAGGVDLRFPHHSNEVAQAEAYHNSHQWVNYFLHAGHLHIDGLKMSKSLKNFITIRKCLERYNARQIRLAFLAHRYDAPMNYAEHGMQEAISLDRTFADFFGNLKATMREIGKEDPNFRKMRPTEDEVGLFEELHRRQRKIHECMRDNVDTPNALLEIQGLVKSTNAYMASKGMKCNKLLLEAVGQFITKILRMFGLTGTTGGDIAYGDEGGEAMSREKAISPVLDAFCEFRDEVRQTARKNLSENTREILNLSDRVRDDVLPVLGVRLEDRGVDQSSVWKLEDSETLVKEIQRKKEGERQKKEEAARQKAEREAKKAEELQKGRLSPQDMFRESSEYAGKYSAFDDSGIPSKDAEGKELSKSAMKTLMKARARQEKLHAKYLEAQSKLAQT